jgi:signal transduction histidine kinase
VLNRINLFYRLGFVLLVVVVFISTRNVYAQQNLMKVEALEQSKACFSYAVRAQKDSAIYFGNKALASIAVLDEQDSLMALTHMRMGIAYSVIRETDSAIYHTAKAIEYAEAANDSFTLGYALRNQGVNKQYTSNEKEAIEYFFRSLDLFEALKNEKFMALVNINLGHLFYELQGYEESKTYFEKSLAILLECKCLDSQISNAINGLGNAMTGLHEDADSVFREAYQVYLNNGDSAGAAIVLNNLGNNFHNLDQHDSAKVYYLKALKAVKKYNSEFAYSGIYVNLGGIFNRENQIDSALHYLSTGIDYSIKYNQTNFQRNGLQELVSLYKKQGMFEKALILEDSAHHLAIELLGEEKLLAAELEKIRFNVDKLEQENTSLKEANELSELVLEQVKNRNRLFAVALFVVLSLLGVILFNRRKLRNANRKLSLNQMELQRSHKKLEVLSEFREKVLSAVGHDLRGYLGNNSGLIELISQGEAGEELLNMLKVNNLAAQDILMNLVQMGKSYRHEGFKTNSHEVCALIESTLDQTNLYFQSKNQEVQTDISCSGLVITGETAFHVILRNLLTNASKFTPDGGKISIGCHMTEDQKVRISVCNEGEPFPDEVKARIMKGLDTVAGRGTNNEKGLGIGLQLVLYLLKQMKSTLEISNTPNGPCVSFELKAGA